MNITEEIELARERNLQAEDRERVERVTGVPLDVCPGYAFPCGKGRDEDRKLCDDCQDAADLDQRQAAEAEYWEEFNRTAWLTSQYNDGREK